MQNETPVTDTDTAANLELIHPHYGIATIGAGLAWVGIGVLIGTRRLPPGRGMLLLVLVEMAKNHLANLAIPETLGGRLHNSVAQQASSPKVSAEPRGADSNVYQTDEWAELARAAGARWHVKLCTRTHAHGVAGSGPCNGIMPIQKT